MVKLKTKQTYRIYAPINVFLREGGGGGVLTGEIDNKFIPIPGN